MTWPPKIERWRQYVVWECRDIPVDLVLAIIKHESGGVAGRASVGTTKPGDLPKRGGGTIRYNHALGLMQIIPGTILSYNQRNESEPVYFEDMTGQDERSARLQIRVGCAVFANGVRALYNYDSQVFTGGTPGNATADQLKLALTIYAHGFGNLRPKLDKLKEDGVALTFKNVARKFPTWGQNAQGQWVNRPLHYARAIWQSVGNHGEVPGTPPPSPNWVMPALMLALSWVFKDAMKKPFWRG